MVKAVILVGGPGKGTRFRPLSLEVPKPLFPLAGRAMIEHHIKACSELNDMQEVCLISDLNIPPDLDLRLKVSPVLLHEFLSADLI